MALGESSPCCIMCSSFNDGKHEACLNCGRPYEKPLKKAVDPETRCEARLFIADDYGDNEATMKCQLKEGHEGPHLEAYTTSGGKNAVTVTWTLDERPEVEPEESENAR